MADIKLDDVSIQNIPGADLLNDAENFLIELIDDNAIGGLRPPDFTSFTTIHSPYCVEE